MPDEIQDDLALLGGDEEEHHEEVVEPVNPEPAEPEEAEEPLEEEVKDEVPEKAPGDDVVVFDRPTIGDLKTAYPDIFKKFPSLKDMYFREQEYSNLFPTVEDARNASENASLFEGLREDVLSGKAERLLGSIREADPKALDTISETILPDLYRLSPDLHWKAVTPILQNTVRALFNEGKKRNDENLMNSAYYMADFLFSDAKVASGEKDVWKPKEETPKEEVPKEDRYANDFTSSTHSNAHSQLKDLVIGKEGDRTRVNPDGTFSNFIQDMIVEKVIKEVNDQMIADPGYMKHINSLWVKAKREGYSDAWKSRILSAYLARAKSLVPSIRAKYISEASGTAMKSSAAKTEKLNKAETRKEPGSGGNPSKSSNGRLNPKAVDWGKTSDLDLFEDRVTYK